jgi:MFS transporter, DHA1 family, inner membrane transport protein
MSATDTPTSSATLPLWMLLIGNFIIGVGILLPAGLLNPLSADLNTSAATAGQLMLIGGVVVALGAPIFAAITSGIERRKLLTFALVLYAICHLASAFVTEFWMLMVLRAITVMGAAIFTPQAAATVGLLVPPEKRAGTIAFIFIGWSAASVAGIPLASYLANLLSWRAVFVGMGGVCLVAALALWLILRPGLFVAPLGAAAWKQSLMSPVILTILLVTALSMSGQMAVFTYIAPILRDAFASGPEAISIAFAVAGIAGVVGNTIASRVVAVLGIDRVIAITIVCLVAGLSLFAASFGTLILAMVGIGLWGLGSFSSNSLQQSRLVAVAPPLASATVSLNTSFVYVGQAVGAAVGGWYMAQAQASGQAPSPLIAWTGAGFTVLALLTSLLATRLAQKT